MQTTFAVEIDDETAARIRELAQRNRTTPEEVVRQLVETGLEELD